MPRALFLAATAAAAPYACEVQHAFGAAAAYAPDVTGLDERIPNIKKGEPSAQAALEALAVLVGTRLFRDAPRERGASLTLRPDPTAALAMAGKLASPTGMGVRLGNVIDRKAKEAGATLH